MQIDELVFFTLCRKCGCSSRFGKYLNARRKSWICGACLVDVFR